MRFLPPQFFRRRSMGGLLLLPVLGGLLMAQPEPADLIPRFNQRIWRQADGLPSNEVTGLCVDRSGYLWVATLTGLARFDGARFLSHEYTPGGESGPSGFAAIVEDPAGDGLWAAPLAGGLIRFRQGRFEAYPLPGDYAGRRVARLFVAADLALWIGFEGGEVMRVLGDRHEIFGEKEGLSPKRSAQFSADGNGRVWLANGPELFWYEAGGLHPLPLANINDNLRIASARQDGPWVLTRGWLHKVIDGKLAEKHEVNAGFNAYSVQALFEDSKGAIWTGTRARGVRRLTLPDEKSDLVIASPEDVSVLFEDRVGNLWAGSNGDGLVRVRSAMVRRFDKTQGLLESHILGVCEDNAGTLWIANRVGGIAFLNEQGRVRTLAPPNVRETFIGRSVVPGGPQGVWAATSHGLWRAEREGLLPATSSVPAGHGQLRVTHQTRDGDLWMALEPGRLGRLRGGVWQEFTLEQGLGPGVVHAITEDPEGRIMVGTEESQLYRLSGERFEVVPLTVPKQAGGIQAIHFDSAGIGWIGTAGAGLLRLDAPAGRHLDEPAGLPSRNITQVISDDFGTLWFGTSKGIFHVRRAELEDFFAGRRARVHAVQIGADEGLGETTCTSAHQPSVWKSRSGMLWFAARQGLVAIDPRRVATTVPPLVVKVDAVRADGVALLSGAPVRLSTKARTVELDFSVLCLSMPGRVRTEVRLRGYDDAWTAADPRGLARYTRLPPGEYLFEVAAHVAGAAGSQVKLGLPLVIEAEWWQTPAFRFSIAVLVLLLGALAVRTWSHRRLRARLAQLEQASALERERARIARNIHDDLGSGLTRISLLTQMDGDGDSRAQLDKIYNTVSTLTQTMDEIVWAVNPKNDDLEGLANYLVEYTQGFLSDAGIRCRVQLPDFLLAHPLNTQGRHHLFMACKEALHNVVKHARATEVSLQIGVESDRLRIVIADNGAGFDPDKNRPGPGWRTGNGLASMSERLAALGGSCEITASAGTIVTFTVPLSAPTPIL